jgi:hypothetical protein
MSLAADRSIARYRVLAINVRLASDAVVPPKPVLDPLPKPVPKPHVCAA